MIPKMSAAPIRARAMNRRGRIGDL